MAQGNDDFFTPAEAFKERVGLFVSLTGSTSSGKSFSSLRLARGIAGPSGKIAVLDTEGGRTLHLKNDFKFDARIMSAPFRPHFFSDAAERAENAGYDVMLIDSFSMEWAGLGGVLDWQAEELDVMVKRALSRPKENRQEWQLRESMKMAAWIKPKMAHKSMVYSLQQRRIPIVFSIRGEESVVPAEGGGRPEKKFKAICNSAFPFEVTTSFRLDPERKGYLDLSDERTFKLEGIHREFFRHGDRISEDHGRLLAEWARGEGVKVATPPPALAVSDVSLVMANGDNEAARGSEALRAFWNGLSRQDRQAVGGATQLDKWKAAAAEINRQSDDDPALQGSS